MAIIVHSHSSIGALRVSADNRLTILNAFVVIITSTAQICSDTAFLACCRNGAALCTTGTFSEIEPRAYTTINIFSAPHNQYVIIVI